MSDEEAPSSAPEEQVIPAPEGPCEPRDEPHDEPDEPDEPPPTEEVGPRPHAAFWFAIGCAVLAVVQLPLALARPSVSSAETPPPPSTSTSASALTSASTSVLPPNTPLVADDDGVVEKAPPLVDPDAPPPPFRVAQLDADPTLDVVVAKIGKRTCDAALLALSVTRRDILRLDAAMRSIHRLAQCHPGDRFTVAMTKEGKRVRAFEWETAPGDFILVHEIGLAMPTVSEGDAASGDAGPTIDAGKGSDLTTMIASHHVLPQAHKRHAVGFVVQADLTKAVVAAGLDGTILELIDDALASRPDVPAVQIGSTFRLVADATYVSGRFDRYDELVALEYRPRPDVPPIRLYHFREGKSGKGWFDAKGHQPMHAKWRLPLSFARVTSRFNPRRLHPVLHTIMPHNGCDFAASPGTPVYAIGAGIVIFEGNAGPSGNLVSVQHDGGYTSGYAHLSRFVPGVSVGTHVDAHQLVGYSGSTGRSTGPHLHLSVKKNGAFIDPQSLKMDAVRVVPPGERSAFSLRRADADAALDAIPIPTKGAKTPPIPAPPPNPAPSGSAGDGDEASDEDDH